MEDANAGTTQSLVDTRGQTQTSTRLTTMI